MIEIVKKYKILIILGIVIIIGIICLSMPKKDEDIEFATEEDTLEIKKEEEIPEEEVKKVSFKIDIKGEVVTPGVYEVDDGMIVLDAINLAGGLTPKADTSNINLSEKLVSEMVIVINSKEEVKESTKGSSVSVGSITSKKEVNQNQKVSLNHGTLEELMTLSGIGEAKAQKIISYRNQTPFKSIEEITNVSGIGASTFEKNKDRLTL